MRVSLSMTSIINLVQKENEIVKPAFDERSDDEDEKPVVVVLNEGDITREEAEEGLL